MSLSQNASSAFHTLESLLNWSKKDLLQLQPEKSTINLIQTMENLLDYFHQAVLLKNLELKKEYDAEEIFISADENMIYASLRNILSNAIKYNKPGGKIFIRIKSVETGKMIEIEDTGIGMSQKKIQELFTYHSAETGSEQSGLEGAGIGLILAKDFLDKNDARLDIISEPKKGTKCMITL